MNTLWFGTVSFDSFSRFILCLYCFVYYVYDNPTYEVANKLICILYLDDHYIGISCGSFVGVDIINSARPYILVGQMYLPLGPTYRAARLFHQYNLKKNIHINMCTGSDMHAYCQMQQTNSHHIYLFLNKI